MLSASPASFIERLKALASCYQPSIAEASCNLRFCRSAETRRDRLTTFCTQDSQIVMPFATDEEWPALLVRGFRALERRGSGESRFYGPLDKLLNYCFAETMSFMVAPQSLPNVDDKGLADFIVFLIVSDTEGRPVMVIEIKNDFTKASTRKAADDLIRRRLRDMYEECPNPRLFGLSVLGTHVRVYQCDCTTGVLVPARQVLQDPDILPPGYLAGEWSLDLLSGAGLKEMQRIVGEIKAISSYQ